MRFPYSSRLLLACALLSAPLSRALSRRLLSRRTLYLPSLSLVNGRPTTARSRHSLSRKYRPPFFLRRDSKGIHKCRLPFFQLTQGCKENASAEQPFFSSPESFPTTVLSYVKELKWDIPQFSTSCLEVESIFNERELVGLANILGSAPCLEFLSLNIGYWSPWCSWKKNVNNPRNEIWELFEIVLPTFLCTVKTIKINNLFRNIHISYGIESANNVDEILEVIDEEIKLVKHLLKISNMLEKMVIIISEDATLLHSSDFLPSITRKLLNLPRTSLKAQIDVSYGKPQKV